MDKPPIPKPDPILPETASIEPSVKPFQPAPKPKLIFGVLPADSIGGKLFRYLLIGFGLIIALLVVWWVSTITSLDTVIFKPSLSGVISNTEGVPIAGATAALGENKVTADEQGRYSFTNLEMGRYQIAFSAEGFESKSQEVVVSRGFLNYNTTLNVSLQPFGEASVVGVFKVKDNSAYDFIDDRVKISEQELSLSSDGKFSFPQASTGQVQFAFQSSNYKDIQRTIELKPGVNDLGSIDLLPAGDIVGSLKSWIKEDIVSDLEIIAEGVDPEFIEKSSEGTFQIRDLEVARSYKVRISHPNYQERDYQLGIKQGKNEIFGFRIVEKGEMVFRKEVKNNDLQLLAAQYDGAQLVQLTSAKDTNPRFEFAKDGKAFYLSDIDDLNSGLPGERTFIPYSVPLTGGTTSRVATNYNKLGIVTPYFAAQMLASVRVGDENTHRVLDVMDITGNNRLEILYTKTGTFGEIFISGNGKYVAYYIQEKSGKIDGLYRSSTSGVANPAKLINKPKLTILSFSHDGNKILYSALSAETGLTDLFLYTVNSGQDTKVRAAYTGQMYQFVGESDQRLVFLDKRNNVTDLYELNLQTNTEKRLTKLNVNEAVQAVYQQPGFIVYQTNRGMYLMDPIKLIPDKLFVKDFAPYLEFDF